MDLDTMLELERRYPRHDAHKDNAIRAAGVTIVRYYQLLSQRLESGEILAADPGLAHRLWRLQAERARRRDERREQRQGMHRSA